jgi:hypothetical protein
MVNEVNGVSKMNDEMRLDETFRQYRDACPDVEPSANFMPGIWQKIEARQGFWPLFERFGGMVASASAALCLLLLALNLLTSPALNTAPSSYTDALMADHSAEKTYYAEAIRNSPGGTDVHPDR